MARRWTDPERLRFEKQRLHLVVAGVLFEANHRGAWAFLPPWSEAAYCLNLFGCQPRRMALLHVAVPAPVFSVCDGRSRQILDYLFSPMPRKPVQIGAPLTFCEPMECLAVTRLPEGPEWLYEVKLDGYRAQVLRDSEGVRLLSRRGESMTHQFPEVLTDVASLPAGTALDGELVALGEDGRPNFNLLQNARSSRAYLVLFAFDILMHLGSDTKIMPLYERRNLLNSVVPRGLPFLQLSESFPIPAARMIALMREHGLEGAVAKRLSSTYEAGRRSGAWVKLGVNRDQDFVVGGYVPGTNGFDSIVVGVYEGKGLR